MPFLPLGVLGGSRGAEGRNRDRLIIIKGRTSTCLGEQVGGGVGNLGGAKLQQIGVGGEGDNAHQQQGGGGGDLQVVVLI